MITLIKVTIFCRYILMFEIFQIGTKMQNFVHANKVILTCSFSALPYLFKDYACLEQLNDWLSHSQVKIVKLNTCELIKIIVPVNNSHL